MSAAAITAGCVATARELALDALHAYKEHERKLAQSYRGRDWRVLECRNVRLFLDETEDGQKVVFAGSDDCRDWYGNFKAWKVARTDIGRVHKGIADCYSLVRDELERTLDPRRRTTFAGHSLGGALAQYAAARAALAGHAATRVHAFGAPMVGNREWADFYDSCEIETHCWVAGWDRVPLRPSFFGCNLGYRRVSGWHFVGLDGSLHSSSPGLLSGKPWRTWTRRRLNHSQETYIRVLDRIRT